MFLENRKKQNKQSTSKTDDRRLTGSKAEVTKETMERGNTTRRGGRGEEGGERGTTGFAGTNFIKRKRAATTDGNSNNSKQQKSPRPHPPSSPSPSSSMLLAQPRPCLMQCLRYLDSESIRQVCLLSKEYRSIIHNDPGMANTWKRALEIRPASSDENAEDKGRLDRLVDQLYHRQLYYRRDRLQLIQEIRIIDPHKFKYSNKLKCSDHGKVLFLMRSFQLDKIVSLRMVSSSTSILPELPSMGFGSIISVLKSIFPLRNLRLLDLSYNTFHYMPLAAFLEDCSSLEQITYNTTDKVNTALNITGTELENCSSLTELHMDNSTFRYYNAGLSNLENETYSNKFLFWQCRSKVLRDVSIKNATYNTNESLTGQPLGNRVLIPLPQKALIKFVRNGPPSLRYFRSDLTPDNREMLRLERPDIVFS